MTKKKGIYGKYTVYRNDGRDGPGGDKSNAKYFVLDYANDWAARVALTTYMRIIHKTNPALSKDLWLELQRICYGDSNSINERDQRSTNLPTNVDV